MKLFVTFGVLYNLLALSEVGAVDLNETGPELRLYNDLFAGYRRHVRPSKDPAKAIPVSVAFFLKRIDTLNIRQQNLNVFGWLSMIWKDEYLKWNASEYNGTNSLPLPDSAVWLPEVTIFNSVDDGTDLSRKADCRVRVSSDGTVVWPPGFNLITSCKVNMLKFPYDTQVCFINLTSLASYSKLLYFEAILPFVGLNQYEESGEWNLINHTAIATSFLSTNGLRRFPLISFKLVLQRKYAYYLINIMLPSLILVFMSCLVFLLPPDSGEKVSLSISVLLSFSVFMLLISEIMPRTSDVIPYLAIHMVLSMCITGLSLVVTVIVVRLYHHDPDAAVPTWMRFLLSNCKTPCYSVGVSSVGEEDRKDDVHVPEVIHDDTNESTKSQLLVADLSFINKVNSLAEHFIKKEKTNKLRDQNQSEWREIACKIDKICFYISFFSLTTITIIFVLLMSTP